MTANNIGLLPIKKIYVGTTPVKRVYIGATLIWPPTPRAAKPTLTRNLYFDDPEVIAEVSVSGTGFVAGDAYRVSWVSGDDGNWTGQIPVGNQPIPAPTLGATYAAGFEMRHIGLLDNTIDPIIQVEIVRTSGGLDLTSDPQTINLRTGASPA